MSVVPEVSDVAVILPKLEPARLAAQAAFKYMSMCMEV